MLNELRHRPQHWLCAHLTGNLNCAWFNISQAKCTFLQEFNKYSTLLLRNFMLIFFLSTFWMPLRKGNITMNKLLVALGLAATVALVGCNKDKAPETGATTGEHLENAVEQTGADVQDAAATATDNVATAVDTTAEQIDAAADHTAEATAEAAAKTEAAARDATAKVAGAVESAAADVKQDAQH